jgi:hypothetical protein
MAITRQQKRKMLRDINDPVKVKRMIARNDQRLINSLNDSRAKRKRKLAVMAIAILFTLIGAAIIFR